MPQRIILVGHCGVDGPRLEAELCKCAPAAEVLSVNSKKELHELCEDGGGLLLINRQLPYGFETEEGIELMCELQQKCPDLKMMLVSDRPDAQEEARSVGAIGGFGKADLGTGKIQQCLREVLN
jgi:hypothetical protein